MDMLNWLKAVFARRAAPEKGYGMEVLYAGWVDLPAELRSRQRDSVQPWPGKSSSSSPSR
jgi:hypothetical protein